MEPIKLPKDVRTAWLEALRGGKYEQGTGLLKNDEGRYCCLGVLCEVGNIKHYSRSSIPLKGLEEYGNREGIDDEVLKDEMISRGISEHIFAEWKPRIAGRLEGEDGETVEEYLTTCPEDHFITVLATLNDEQKYSFEEIATIIEVYTVPVDEEE